MPRNRSVSTPSPRPTSPATAAPANILIQGEMPVWMMITGELLERMADV